MGVVSKVHDPLDRFRNVYTNKAVRGFASDFVRGEPVYWITTHLPNCRIYYVDFTYICEFFNDPVEAAHELRQKWQGYQLKSNVIGTYRDLICFSDVRQADRFGAWVWLVSNAGLVEKMAQLSGKPINKVRERYLRESFHPEQDIGPLDHMSALLL